MYQKYFSYNLKAFSATTGGAFSVLPFFWPCSWNMMLMFQIVKFFEKTKKVVKFA